MVYKAVIDILFFNCDTVIVMMFISYLFFFKPFFSTRPRLFLSGVF